MSLSAVVLPVSCEDNALACSYFAPENPRGVIVLFHGIPSVNPPAPNDRGYPGWAEDLASKGWLAVWGDLRARGGSPGYFSIEGWVRDALALIDEVHALPAARGLPLAVVGVSAGGCVSAEAIRRGASADALALLGAPATWLFFAGDGPAGVKRITEEAGMALAPDVLEDPTSWAAEFETITTENAIADVRVPILILNGTADDVVPVEHAHLLATQAPEAELAIVDGAPHILQHDPKAMTILDDWLDRTLK
jgi:alpha-beta hydrolase superfamily lysophospholipase